MNSVLRLRLKRLYPRSVRCEKVLKDRLSLGYLGIAYHLARLLSLTLYRRAEISETTLILSFLFSTILFVTKYLNFVYVFTQIDRHDLSILRNDV